MTHKRPTRNNSEFNFQAVISGVLIVATILAASWIIYAVWLAVVTP